MILLNMLSESENNRNLAGYLPDHAYERRDDPGAEAQVQPGDHLPTRMPGPREARRRGFQPKGKK